MRRILLLIALIAQPALADDWTTFYEQSGYKQTPTYAQTIEYCERLAAASPWVHFTTYGESPQGRALPLLIVDRRGNFTSESVRKTNNAVFLIQAGIHSGEIDGKDAGLMLIRDIAIRKDLAGIIDNVTLLFIPIFSVDGHERISRFNRANQNGPTEMGWRTTAQNLNLNRDYLKADAPEMQAWLRLYNEWLPEFFADCHVTDGADYQYAITHALELFGNMDEGLTEWTRDRYLAPMERLMEQSGFPTVRYASFRVRNEPRSGLESWAAPPRFSEGYTAIQNRPGLLIETHMLKDYKTRVSSTYHMLRITTELLGMEHERLKQLCADADRHAASAAFRARSFPLNFKVGPDSVMIDYLGVEYTVEKSELTGGDWHRYTDQPATFRIPYFNTQIPTAGADLPEAYIVPREWTAAIEKLALHGVALRRTKKEETVEVSAYRLENPSWRSDPFEGRHLASYEPRVFTETRTYPAGSVVVDMNQRAARVAAHLLEPSAPDCLVLWGFFDTIFEQKEYIETYVIEEMAREMIRKDPGLLEQLEVRKAEDPEFAADAERIRDWLYRRTPYWDDRIGVYPVGRIFDKKLAQRLLR